MTAGIALARWFAKEAERVYAVMEETRNEGETNELIGFIRSRPGNRVTPRDVHRWRLSRYPTCEAASKPYTSWTGGDGGPRGLLVPTVAVPRRGSSSMTNDKTPISQAVREVLSFVMQGNR